MRKKGTITLSILLILLGAFLLLNELGVTIPGWDILWPVFPLAVGLTLLGSYFFGEKREPGRVFFGTAAILIALVFFFITLGPMEYEALGSWWPVFVLIGGVAFLAQWAAARFRDWSALFLGIVALVVGGAGLAIRQNMLGEDTAQLLPSLWPVLVVLAGIMLLLRALLGRRS
jgi:hypothetical protein